MVFVIPIVNDRDSTRDPCFKFKLILISRQWHSQTLFAEHGKLPSTKSNVFCIWLEKTKLVEIRKWMDALHNFTDYVDGLGEYKKG